MIVSNSNKYIFLKTRKTAGSSIQVALSTKCNPLLDIITGNSIKEGKLDESHSGGWNINKFFTNHPHPSIELVKKWAGDDWKNYFKFAFVRNPFDIVVSRYHWNLGKKNKPTSIDGFNKWIKNYFLNGEYKEDEQWRYIYINGKNELDFIGRYENLKADFNFICDKINISPPELGLQKSGYRDKKHYSKYYNQESIELVNKYFKKDLTLFNYNFDKDFYLSNFKSIINKNVINDNNINGPSLIRVPDFIKNKLGKYYLYFANHDGKNIRMAYSNNLRGPWTLYKQGTLQLENTICKTHIASPDVHVKDNKLIMYYHGDIDGGQYTFKSTSIDGINFKTDNKVLGSFYFRVFNYLNKKYAIAKNGNVDSIIYQEIKGKFTPQFNFLDKSRHTAVYVDLDILYIFYTLVEEAPESLYVCKIQNWEVIDNYKLKEPTYTWEGSEQPNIPSSFGTGFGFLNQLRDPCIFEEDNNIYLLYSYGGESGIAISNLTKI